MLPEEGLTVEGRALKERFIVSQEFVLASTTCGESLKIVKWGNDTRLRKTRWEFSSDL